MDELNIVFPVCCRHAVKSLKDGERGRLMLGIYDYCTEGKEPNLVGNEQALWPEFKAVIDETREKEAASKRAKSEAGRLGGLARVAMLSSASKDPPSLSPDPSLNPPKERVSKDTPKKSPQTLRFSPPSIQEVSEYCKQRGNNVDANTFVDFYESKGWMVGKTKMKDWKAAVRTWERSRDNNKNTHFEQPKENWNDTHRFIATGDFEGYWEELVNGEWRRMER